MQVVVNLGVCAGGRGRDTLAVDGAGRGLDEAPLAAALDLA